MTFTVLITYSWTQPTGAVSFLQIFKIIIFKEMTAEKCLINLTLDRSHVMPHASQCDVTKF